MKYVKCDLCGADDYIVIESMGSHAKPLTNVCCRRCGLVYVNPTMDESECLAFYSSKYDSKHRGISNSDELFSFLEEAQMTAYDRFAYIQNYIPPSSHILEIGCASGALLEILRDHGHLVSGIEPSEHLSKLCRSHDIDVYPGLFEDFTVHDSSCDIVVMFHVLEHFVSPLQVMNKVRALLRVGGKAIVEVPDIWCLWGNPHTGENYIFTEAHPVTFSENTLRILAARTGFSLRLLPRICPRHILAEFVADCSPIQDMDYTRLKDDYVEIINNVFRYRSSYGWRQELFKDTRIRYIELQLSRVIGETWRRRLVELLKRTGIVRLIQRMQ